MTTQQLRRHNAVLFVTRYSRMGASSRYRFLQYVAPLEAAGMPVEILPLFDDRSLAGRYAGRSMSWLTYARCIASRFASVRDLNRYAVVVIEKELLPFLPLLAEAPMLPRRFVLDYDDAIFHQYDAHANPFVRRALRNKIPFLMRRATAVIAGNDYVGDFARRAGAERVVVIPTVVDLSKYPSAPRVANDVFTIGWIGSPSTAKYLRAIAPALRAVCAGRRGKVVLIGAGDLRLPGVSIEVLPWSEETEVADLRRCDVGIMPLPDEPWARGKCGLKLIQYMACGLPVVASPVGVNTDIVDGTNGFLARNLAQWIASLQRLQRSPELCRTMGAAGRSRVEACYSLSVAAPRMVSLLHSTANLDGELCASPATAASVEVAGGEAG